MALVTIPATGPGSDDPHGGLSPHLVADLADWRLHLHTRSFTAVSVAMLLHDLRRTVPSALGYTLVLVAIPGLPEVSITVADAPLPSAQIRSTISFDLPVVNDLAAGATFYAGEAGAFDRLARLLGRSNTFGAGQVELGGTPDDDVAPGVQGLADHTRVNYALGVLLGRGQSFEEAEEHLQRLAGRLGSLEAAAEHLLTTFAV